MVYIIQQYGIHRNLWSNEHHQNIIKDLKKKEKCIIKEARSEGYEVYQVDGARKRKDSG